MTHKIDEYVGRMEKCIPDMIQNIHISMFKELKDSNLTISQTLTLMALGYIKTCKMCELAKSVNMNVSAMTEVIDGLVRAGLIERKRSLEDRRVVMISLTSSGNKMDNGLKKHRRKKIYEIIKTIDEDERENVISGIEKIIEAFSIAR